MTKYHVSVMPSEVLQYLEPEKRSLIVDGTLGDGGHAELILKHSGPDCRVLGIDRDAEILERARKRLSPFGDRVVLAHGNYSELGRILRENGIKKIDGLLLDLGMSSFQVDSPERGFSFQHEGPLDMRMNRQETSTAADLLVTLSDKELERVFKEYGEERNSKRIVRKIRDAQSKHPITTTHHLEQLLSSAAHASRKSSIHPATRSFQALRIAVNLELEHLEACLQESLEYLSPGGRLVLISFHSLEDRRVKNFFRTQESVCVCPPRLPVCVCGQVKKLNILTRRVVRPTAEEIRNNPRASSSRLRAAERVNVA
ncbi:MAG: 16S rRNA (cytosine(1402)-N(4))-methyltransferase RsmH [Candidatus Nitronauta litoralis]|uniref:Ribosomal RNA small subunit methyltransferase H n=1 Tax=Candidatus Nitronauta litoralis TaxID=2705533 RepID=A0A7T0FYW2_9BACT|nr:MAG: 16S rRNA (cytosine(1402)-N(4))-methyltransferase RsmH [Candidatus Nitronauta litoralis]